MFRSTICNEALLSGNRNLNYVRFNIKKQANSKEHFIPLF